MSQLKIADHGTDRRGFFKIAGGISAALAFSATLAACGGGDSTATTGDGSGKDVTVNKDGSITAGIAYDISTFLPSKASGAAPFAANLHIFEGLYGLDPATRKRYNALATGDPTKVDDTTYKVTIRDAKFHDGTPVTAKDVVSTFTAYMDKKSLFSQFLFFIESVNAADDKTVEFKLNQPFPLFADRISLVNIFPAAALSNTDAFDQKPIGSGPYKFVSATKGSFIQFERNDNYNGPRPALAKTMKWNIVVDDAARTAAMQSKEVQAIENVPTDAIDSLKGAGVNVEAVQSFGLLFMMFNCEKAPFDKKEVRQALFYALDAEKLVNNALMGYGAPAKSFLQQGHKDYVEASTVYSHNLDKAKQLLKAGGAEGATFVLHTTDHPWVKSCAQFAQENLKELGLNVTIESLKSSALYSDKVDTGSFDVVLAPGDPSVFGDDVDLLLSWWYRGETWPAKRFRWANTPEYKQVQELMNSAVKSADPKADWKKAIDIIAEQAPLYPVLHRKLPTAWDATTLKDFKPLPTTGLYFLNVGSSK